jgi:hypothetical protein
MALKLLASQLRREKQKCSQIRVGVGGFFSHEFWQGILGFVAAVEFGRP